MSTVSPLSLRCTFFSSRLMWNTHLSEMASLPCSSFPNTGTLRGPSSGSSKRINFTLVKSEREKGKRGSINQIKHTQESSLRETRFCFVINVEQEARLYITVFVLSNYPLNRLLKVVFIITNYSALKITIQHFFIHSGRHRITSKQISQKTVTVPHSLMSSLCFILVSVARNPESILGKLGIRWKHTLDRKHLRASCTHLHTSGQFILIKQYSGFKMTDRRHAQNTSVPDRKSVFQTGILSHLIPWH